MRDLFRRSTTAAAVALSMMLLAQAAPAFAGEATPIAAAPEDQFARRGEGLVALINGKAEPAQIFSTAFLAQRPPERLKELAAKLRGRFGPALGVSRVEASGDNKGTIFIDFENSQLPFQVILDPAAPHLLVGLAVSG